MEIKKKADRWLSQLLHCRSQSEAIVAEIERGPHSAAFLASCHERLEFYSAREQVVSSRIRRQHRKLTQKLAEARNDVAEASQRLLETIDDAVKKHGKVVIMKKKNGSVEIEVPATEKRNLRDDYSLRAGGQS